MSQVPLALDIDEVIHRAIRLRAAKEGISVSEVVMAIFRKALAAEIEEAAGLPPLAAVIQNHHDRQQEAMRHQTHSPRPQ